MPPAPSEPRAARRRLAALLLLVTLYKLAYLIEYARLPFLRGPIFDSVVYLRQARAVLAGRFDDAALLAFSPLYGYFLALCGGAHRVGPPLLLQLGLGTLNLWLLYRLARPRFGEAAALLSAGLYFGYGLLLSYESKIVSETLALTLALLAASAYQSAAFAAGRLPVALLAGALIGLSVLQRASLIFVPPLAVALAALPFRAAERRAAARPRLRRTLGVALGLWVVLGGNGLWNLWHSGFFVPVIMVSQTVQKTTDPEFGDDFAVFAQNESGTANALDVVNQAERRLAARRAGQPDPEAGARRGLFGVNLWGVIKGAPVKLAHTFTDYEVTYDYGYFGERSEIRSLGLLPVSFGTLLLLGLAGAVALARREGIFALVPYLPYALGSVATTVVFHASSRYRLFLVIPLLLLAGFGVVSLWRLAAGWRLRPAGLLLVLPAAAVCVGLAVRTLTYQMLSPAQWELRVAQSAAVAGDMAELQRRIARARAVAPGNAAVEQRIKLLTSGAPIAAPRPPG